MVPKEGLEPSHPKALAPKASVSTISPPGHFVYLTLITISMAESKRFELLMSCPIHAFQAGALDHYANSPLCHSNLLNCYVQLVIGPRELKHFISFLSKS